jgi:hypothetical protein
MSAKARIREATIADRTQVELLLDHFQMRTDAELSSGSSWWEWLWRRNANFGLDRIDHPLGWVLEADNEIVGFFGNIPMLYQFGQKTLLASIASHWAVRKPFRSQTNELATAYFNQPNVDLLMVTTAIKPTVRIFERHAAKPMPLSNYQKVLFWVIDPRGFISASLCKKKIHPNIAKYCGAIISPFIKTVSRLAKHHIVSKDSEIQVQTIQLDDVNGEFDVLWQRKNSDKGCLYAFRRAEDLLWHFECISQHADIRIICCRRLGILEGYAILMCEEIAEIGLVRAKLVDLFVLDDMPDILNTLLAESYKLAKTRGCHIFEIVGCTPQIRALAKRFKPLSRLYENLGFYYKASSMELDKSLELPNAWYPTLFDGDSSLFGRR